MIILTLGLVMCAVIIGIITTLFGGFILIFGDVIIAGIIIALIIKIVRKIKKSKKSKETTTKKKKS